MEYIICTPSTAAAKLRANRDVHLQAPGPATTVKARSCARLRPPARLIETLAGTKRKTAEPGKNLSVRCTQEKPCGPVIGRKTDMLASKVAELCLGRGQRGCRGKHSEAVHHLRRGSISDTAYAQKDSTFLNAHTHRDTHTHTLLWRKGCLKWQAPNSNIGARATFADEGCFPPVRRCTPLNSKPPKPLKTLLKP